MAASSSSMLMRRGIKPFLALGAVAAVPVVIFASEEYITAHSKNKRGLNIPESELWREDEAHGFLNNIIARFRSLGSGSSSAESTPTSAAARTFPFKAHQGQPLEDQFEYKRLGQDPPTRLLAQEFSDEVSHIKREAEKLLGGRPLPTARFTDTEIMRYAIHHGFLRAQSDAARQRALQKATTAVVETAEWIVRYPFASNADLDRFKHLVWWTQASPDARPVLHVDISQAVIECRGPVAIAFANAVVTQVERAIESRLKDAPEGHDRVDVVIYAGGTTAFSASRAARVLKSVVTTLSHHFPGRLHQLTLLDLPKFLQWIVRGVKKLVHAETAKKVVPVTSVGWHREEIIDEEDEP